MVEEGEEEGEEEGVAEEEEDEYDEDKADNVLDGAAVPLDGKSLATTVAGGAADVTGAVVIDVDVDEGAA